jgi:hypothetical protein
MADSGRSLHHELSREGGLDRKKMGPDPIPNSRLRDSIPLMPAGFFGGTLPANRPPESVVPYDGVGA